MLDPSARLGGSRRQLAAALTERQREVLQLVVDGLATPEIARRLSIGAGTVRRHLRMALERLGEGPRGAASAGPDRGSRAGVPRVPRPRRPRGRGSGGRILARELQRATAGPYGLAVLLVATGRPGMQADAADLARPLGADAWGQPVSELVQAVRRNDYAVVWTPEKYLVILPGGDLAGARAVAGRLRAVGHGHDFAIGAAEWQVGEPSDALLARAERAAKLDRLQRDAERTLDRAIQDR